MRKGALTIWLAIALIASIAPTRAWHLLHDHSAPCAAESSNYSHDSPALPSENPLAPEQDDCPLCHSLASASSGVLVNEAAVFPEGRVSEYLVVDTIAWSPLETPLACIARGPPSRLQTIA